MLQEEEEDNEEEKKNEKNIYHQSTGNNHGTKKAKKDMKEREYEANEIRMDEFDEVLKEQQNEDVVRRKILEEQEMKQKAKDKEKLMEGIEKAQYQNAVNIGRLEQAEEKENEYEERIKALEMTMQEKEAEEYLRIV